MNETIKFPYKIRKGKNYKKLILRVKKNGEISISAPTFVSEKAINSFILKNKNWIIVQQNKIKNNYVHSYEEDDIFFIEGECYYLKLENNSVFDDIILENKEKYIILRSKKILEKSEIISRLNKFYKKRTYVIVNRYIDEIKKIDFQLYCKCKKVNVRKANSQWGSCSRTNNINFSLRLSMLPLDCIRYVVYHEFVHLIIKNHSKCFYSQLSFYLPRRKEIELKIKDFSNEHNLFLI